jgi:small nuclear ribonucleoprotein (snRNP)-like protein
MGDFKRLVYMRQIVVNLRDGAAIQGVLMGELRGVLVLRNAQYHENGTEPKILDGETIIPRDRILFVQAP